MRILVNGLSIRGLSGRHVVLGFLKPLTNWTVGEHEFIFLHPPDWETDSLGLAENVTYHPALQGLEPWAKRALWEGWSMPKLLKEKKIDLVFTPAGSITPGCPVPQVCLGQNPWCMVPGVQKGISQRIKAAVQRRAYRYALRNAAKVFFISEHLRDLYYGLLPQGDPAVDISLPKNQDNIVYPCLDQETLDDAAKAKNTVEKDPMRILAVSSMAPWKGLDTIISAVSEMRSKNIPVTLHQVGPWPNSEYEQKIRNQIQSLKLEDAVVIKGKVTNEQLHQNYAEAKVFCLMSECESFGIPALEAQAFGTPVVGSNVCAMPEIGGKGGLFGAPKDVQKTAEMLSQMLTDDVVWKAFSKAAVENSEKFRWEECAKPLMTMFDLKKANT